MLVATGNAGKAREFAVLLEKLFDDRFFDLKSWPGDVPDVVEDGELFVQNALKKAVEVSLATGTSTLADDSGLEVDALGGRPGVYSARFAGEDATTAANNQKLVESLEDVPSDARSARYVAVVALSLVDDAQRARLLEARGISFSEIPELTKITEISGVSEISRVDPSAFAEGTLGRLGDRVVVWFRGTCEGQIILSPRGDAGFGYDPYFLIPDWGETMAEVSMTKKNERSHRAQAVRKLIEFFG